jgi:hypothetical protein
MITADTLKTLTTFTAAALTRAVQDAGYKGPEFTSCKFLGMTNGGQFCYRAEVATPEDGPLYRKVFLSYDAALGRITASV